VVTVSHNCADTGISYDNRTHSARFLSDKCMKHTGPMRQHVPQAPLAP
jgi:hypothetical protein